MPCWDMPEETVVHLLQPQRVVLAQQAGVRPRPLVQIRQCMSCLQDTWGSGWRVKCVALYR